MNREIRNRNCWFQLVNLHGDELKETHFISCDARIQASSFQRQVKQEWSNMLCDVDAGDLDIYANQAALNNNKALSIDAKLINYGRTE